MKSFLIFAVLFLSLIVDAAPPQQYATNPPNGSVYLDQSDCPSTCYPIVLAGDIQDVSVSTLQTINGIQRWVEDSTLRQAKLDAAALAVSERITRRATIRALRIKVKDGTATAAEQRQLIVLLIEELGMQ
jgi:hypothetical protein